MNYVQNLNGPKIAIISDIEADYWTCEVTTNCILQKHIALKIKIQIGTLV